jgi:hypothetical protein
VGLPLGVFAVVTGCGGKSKELQQGSSDSSSMSGSSGMGGETTGVPLDGAAIASDATGDNLIVAANDLWTSSDGGVSWTNRTPSGITHDLQWVAVASDGSGTKLVALANGFFHLDPAPPPEGGIFASTDGGRTWIDRTPADDSAHNLAWRSVASDSTGTNLVAVAQDVGVFGPGSIWTSTDGGASWVDRTLNVAAMANQSYSWVASDATGTKLAVAANGGDLWTSTDGGATWTDGTASGPAHGGEFGGLGWSSVASDATGARLVAVADTGDIWASTDSGVTWIDRTPSGPGSSQVWLSVASDSAGTNLMAIDGLVTPEGGDIWTSHDGGVTWYDETADNPALNRGWRAVATNASGSRFVATYQDGVWVD